MSNLEIAFASIGAVAAIFGIVYTIYTRRKDKSEKRKVELADKEKQAKAVICFHTFQLESDKYNFIIGIPKGDYKNTITMLTEFPITVANEGGLDLEDITVIYKYVEKSPLPMSAEYAKMVDTNYTTIKLEHKYYKDQNQQCSAVIISHIPPKVAISTKELIRIEPSSWNIDIPFKTKDKKNVIAKARINTSYLFEVIILMKNLPPRVIKIKLTVLESNGFDDLVIKSVKRIKETRKEKNVAQAEKYFIHYPDIKTTYTDQASIKTLKTAYFNEQNVRLLNVASGGFIFIEQRDKSERSVLF
jgi:hypothetical protein